MTMKLLLLGATLFGVIAGTESVAEAETKRALLIGINKYRAPSAITGTKDGITDLKGCVNDVTAIRELLIAKYGFKPQDIVMITDKDATKDAILKAFKSHLIDKSAAGDETVFYYSGHGSQVRNSLSDERDKLDEGIVPVDVMKHRTLIRDKDFSGLFNNILDKGARVTAFFDSCFSGSVGRGLAAPVLVRQTAPITTRDLAMKDAAQQPPEERGALIFSASQDFQPSADWRNEAGLPMGAFSQALIRAMRTAPAYESAERLFIRTKAVMAASGLPMPQEPVLAGRADVRAQGIFGMSARADSADAPVAFVGRELGAQVRLQGGVSLGLTPGTELRRLDGDQPMVRLRVAKVLGPSRTIAATIEGDLATLKPGDLFVVDKEAVTNDSRLGVWLPPTKFRQADLARLAAELGTGRPHDGQWVADPTEATPTHVVAWSGSTWEVRTGSGATKAIGPALTVKALSATLKGLGAKAPQVYVQFPPAMELSERLKAWGAEAGRAVTFVPAAADAEYWLVGRKAGKAVQYALALPNRTAKDPAQAMPLRSDWLALEGGPGIEPTARQIATFATRAGRIKGWLKLEAPSPDVSFPYRLAVKHAGTNAVVADGKLKANESYGLVLQLDKAITAPKVRRRYVYVFSIDGNGATRLLFPRKSHGNVENNFPGGSMSAPETTLPGEIALGPSRLFTVTPPYGVETYVALTTEEAIPNPEVLEADGIRTRSDATNPLERLVADLGAGTRGEIGYKVKHNWSLERLMLTSEAKK